jgi:glutathione S-transferase
MTLVEIVTALALLQYLTFAALVGRAQVRYGVKAPATTGHEVFERFYRVQMNTLELLVVFLPALWLAARYWSPTLVSGIGAIYLVGRVVYFRAYTREPARRSLGFNLSLGPAVLLLLVALVGAVLAGLT